MSATVLIVDDSLTVRMDLAEAFAAAGFHTVACATAEEARAALSRGPVDIAVLDVLLPDADGIALLAELRRSPAAAEAAVLMLSTEAEVKDRIRGLQTGADEYVGKPYDRGYVVARAEELLRQRQAAAVPDRPLVLVIDDSATFREELAEALELAGYATATAATGEEGLHLAAARRPEAVIVDGVLPGIDGATVVRRMRLDAALRTTPCVLLTADDEPGAELRALDSGADAFVRKGEDVGLILARLSAVLRTASAGVAGAGSTKTASLLGPKRILAVDDSETFLQELGQALREEGYDVVLSRSGEEALEMLAVQPVDCILLDVLMPGLGGKEACRRIKSSPPPLRDIPLLLLTAVDERQAMIEGLSTGADDYIAKSSDFEVVKARVRAQIRRRQFEDEHRRIREGLLREEQARELAERESRFKSQFLANMSHELRTPLNAIIGFSEVLVDRKLGPLNDMQAGCIEDVLSSGRHLLNLINDVLDLSKVAAGRMELHLVRLAVPPLVAQVVAAVQPLAQVKDVGIEQSVRGPLPEVMADSGRLTQILFNLLSNAVKFTPTGGTIAVRMELAEGEGPCAGGLRISVSDTGIGIRAEDQERIFREFEQVRSAYSRSVQGTGLGLALTRRLVELHGGRLWVDSAGEGRGSTFCFTLPVG